MFHIYPLSNLNMIYIIIIYTDLLFLHVCFRLLAEKSTELGEQVNKLCNGLLKISDTREKVEAMTVELEEAKKQVAEFQTQCEEYLSVILEQKREADRHQKVNQFPLFIKYLYSLYFMLY